MNKIYIYYNKSYLKKGKYIIYGRRKNCSYGKTRNRKAKRKGRKTRSCNTRSCSKYNWKPSSKRRKNWNWFESKKEKFWFFWWWNLYWKCYNKRKEETTEVQNQEEVKEEKQDKKENKNASLTLEELTKKYKDTTEKEELFTEALQNRDANKGSILSSKVQQIQKNKELQKSQQIEKIQQTEKVVEQKKEYQKEQIPERTKSAKHPSSIIIEKPNYYKSSKFSRKKNTEVTPESIAKSKQKFKQVVLALALCFCAIFCVTNCIVIDKAQSSISTEQDTYDINLATYFEKIATLDETNKAMDMFETYPEELNMPSQTAKKSNWFDRFCNWVSGIFGG